MTAGRTLITLCTYNERENIERLVPDILSVAPDVHVLIVDDNSPDGTGDCAEELSQADERIHVLHREGKLGLGTAILAGFRHAIESEYEFVLNMDADLSHHPRYIPPLREAMERVDVAIGSRYVSGGGVEGWSWYRHIMSRGINCYARWLLWLRTKDNSGSFRCYRVSRLREIDLGRIRARGYAFFEEILYRCRRVGCTFEEVPIVFEDRRYGQSKINRKEVFAALWVIFVLAVQNLFRVRVRHR